MPRRLCNPPRYRTATLLCCAALLTACGHQEAPSAGPTAAIPTAAPGAAPTGPSANAPLAPQTFSLATAMDFAQVKNPQMIHPQFSLTPPEVDSPVIFAVIRNEEQNLASPVLLKKIGAAWRVCEVVAPSGAQTGEREWVHAAACPARHELFAILDDASAARGWQLTLLHSRDAGLTFETLAALKKPTNAAEYAGFAMAASGAGRVSLHLDDDADNFPHGYYHYVTTDGGKTWTGPSYEPDDIVDADPQAEDDAIGEAIKATEGIPAP